MAGTRTDGIPLDPVAAGRAALRDWERGRPESFWAADPNLQAVLRLHLGSDASLAGAAPALARAGALSAGRIDELSRYGNRDEALPQLRRWDGVGEEREEVLFNPGYHQLGELVWSTGVLSALREPGRDLLAGALFYLLAQNGEMGHACPVTCTAGLVKLLQQVGSPEQRARWLPGLTAPDYATRLHASQFVTEVQGGSDVGANGCRAEPDGAGGWSLSGEKWFCSVADAAVFLVSARVPGGPGGTAGLGLFLVPRLLDGRPNGFRLRRLKWKLGTRSLASAEIDFAGARAEPVGPVDRGFKNLVGVVLDTSRVYNALAAGGMMRRALSDARRYAAHRRAFGRPIGEFPAVRETLARMAVRTAAAVSTTFRILALSDQLAALPTGHPRAEALRAARRTHVNLNKVWTAIASTEVVRDGIEIMGGNGTIEEFSVLPRLYRDAIVIESWEGTHNTLCAQLLRDFRTRSLHRPWLDDLRAQAAGLTRPATAAHQRRAAALIDALAARIERLLAGPEEYGERHVRRVVEAMGTASGYLSLAGELEFEDGRGSAGGKADLVELFRRLYVDPADPMEDEGRGPLEARVAAAG